MELKFKDINVCDYSKKINTSCISQTDIIVPDTKPDIYKILCVEALADCSDYYVKKDEMFFSGNVYFNIMYIGDADKNRIYNIEYTAPFNHRCELNEDSAGCEIAVKCKTSSTDFNVKNSRKLSVMCNMSLCADILKYSNFSAVEKIEGDDAVPYVTSSVKSDSVIVCKNHEFDMSESFTLPSGGENLNIHNLKLRVDINEIKTVNNKAIIKGVVPAKIFYTATSEPAMYETEFSFTEICDIDNADSESMLIASFDISSVSFTVDIMEDETEVEFEAKIKGSLKAYEKSEYTLASKLYSPDYTYKLNEVNTLCQSLVNLGSNQITVKDELSVSQMQNDISKIYYMSVYPSCNKVSTIKNAVKIEGNVQANIIYMNTENELDSVVKNIPYESEITADVSPLSNCTIESDVSTVNYGYILGSSKEIQARCILKAEVFLIKHSPVTVVSDFSEDKSLPIDKSSQPSITVCYPQSNTCLWDYAVKYNTTCEEIAQVNGISAGEELTPGKPLLIPKRQCVK